MKIVLATKTMDVGGIERIVVAIARELRSRGHEIWVVSSGGYLVRDLERDGTNHVTAPLEITSPAGIVRSAQTLRRLVRENQVDLVHSFSATTSVAATLALKLLGRREAGGVHLLSSPMGLQNSAKESGLVTWLRNWVLTLGAERIVVISPEIRRHLLQVGVPERRLVDLNFVGLDLDSFHSNPDDHASVCQEFGFEPNSRIVSTIGALHPRKSHELFVDAAAQIVREVPEARFLVVGGGDLREALERQARERGLDGKLRFTGVRDDIARLLTATEVYVKPGIVEGFIGITVLEAFAVSKPVVAFDTEDVKMALVDGVTGLVARNADVPALADKIVYLLRNPDVGARMGGAGRQLVADRFHFGHLAEPLERFYQEIYQGHPQPVLAQLS